MAALLAYIRAEAAPIDAPLIPASWRRTIEADRWASVYPLGRVERPDVFFHARLMLRHPTTPTRAVFVCTGPRVVLDHLAARIAGDALPWSRTWLTIAELRDDSTQLATQMRALWPDERPLDGAGEPIGTLVAHLRRMAGHEAEAAETAEGAPARR